MGRKCFVWGLLAVAVLEKQDLEVRNQRGRHWEEEKLAIYSSGARDCDDRQL